MTINSFTDITQQYETTLDDCTCPGFQKWHHCKHNEALRRLYAKVRRETFDELRRKYDSRLNGDEQTRRCYYELQFSA